ncbi:sugar phosphate isomerase/epimerase family protein [Albibacterium bauzanense]|uniref:Xylose isomerase-like TIM barrel protein n=1 Tax=Albibacterium bauzanense TaxID=653929 RepID=A0A4R1M792_9SPHI|nr:TIM barrel protein [Albibacterium bauzanense]TCK85699.1 xylose isomerase-like TIM barrel protein [Albibacterium bauzanense]
MNKNNFPKLHNATWPGIVGKGDGSEPLISFDTMLQKTAAAEVDGVKFDGIDLGLFDYHVNIDGSDDYIKKFVDKVGNLDLEIGSLVAPIWAPTGGPAMGSKDERNRFVESVRKASKFGKKLRDMGIRTANVIRIDSASDVDSWCENPVENSKLIVQTFREACDVAADFGERLAAEGEICWGGMQSWRIMLETLEAVDKPNMGFQADMAHTLLYLQGYNSPEDRVLPKDFQWDDRAELDKALKMLTDKLRPWTIDFHVAQNDGTVFGSGAHDKTGRHCLANDPNGKLDIAHDAGFWLRDNDGKLTKATRHICWDGCMFPNQVMEQQQTWNNILSKMIEVREAHGWYEA